MTFWEKIKCRLRIVDSYGTDPWFNEPSLAVKSGSGQVRNFYNPRILFAEDTGFTNRILKINTLKILFELFSYF